VDIITHGFWASVLEGYPYMFEEVTIGNNVIVGWKTVIMGGVNITNNVVIGTHSTVVKSLEVEKGIYVGSPAKLIKTITEPTKEQKSQLLEKICIEFTELMGYYQEPIMQLDNSYPVIILNGLMLNTVTLECQGTHDVVTDAFRDFMRRYGIRFFVKGRKFGFNLTRK
jgi:acyl-[acyl carrier protein]--UDP-N-acetylglucosamine O-acyltransferase